MVKKKQTRKDVGRAVEEESKTRPHWKDVLLVIYNDELPIGKEWEWDDTITKNNAKKFGIPEQELIHALFYLENNRLIESRHASPWMELTKKGFDVALKIEGEKSAARTQSVLVYVMLLIAVTGAFQFFSGTGAYDSTHLLLAYIVMLILIAAGIWGVYKKFGP